MQDQAKPLEVQLEVGPGLIRQGMESFFESESLRFQVVGLRASGQSADVCVTDNIDALAHLAIHEFPVVLCARLPHRSDILTARRLGIRACVSPTSNFEHLGLAIESVHAGREYLCPEVSAVMCQATPDSTLEGLTPRESDVVYWISQGYSNKQVARQLGISPHTVETHKRNVMQKMGAHKVTALIRFALTQELSPGIGSSSA
jgi:DNA-binding NarL/FixJ family response regulator